MILKYGSYAHDVDEATVSIQRALELTERGDPKWYRETWNIEGVLHGDTQGEITTAIRNLERAYARGAQDAVLYLSDGTTETAHALKGRDTVGGVVVTSPPSFPRGDGAEYSTFRSYSITLEALSTKNLPTIALVAFQEKFSYSGGGARWIMQQPLNGPPIRQQVAQLTPYRCSQSGRAVGLFAYPQASPPKYPQHEHTDQRQRSTDSPIPRNNGMATDYAVSWQYEFESATPFA